MFEVNVIFSSLKFPLAAILMSSKKGSFKFPVIGGG